LAIKDAVENKAFPHVYKVRHGRDEDPTDDELREAVRAELHTLVRASWRREHVRRRDDPESRLAAEMDATGDPELKEEAKQLRAQVDEVSDRMLWKEYQEKSR